MEISKELLSEVYNTDANVVKVVFNETSKLVVYRDNQIKDKLFPVNIYELAHKCKEWAFKQKHGYIILSGFTNLTDNIYEATIENPNTTGIYREIFCADTEVEAIFKACEWILKEIKK